MAHTNKKKLSAPPGGQSHSGGDAYVRLKRPPFSVSLSPKDPYFFTIACALTQRPHDFLYFSLTECQISLTKCQICSPNAKFRSPNAPNSRFLTTEPSYFCIFLSPNAKNHALTQWPLIFWACVLTECPSLSERGPYTRIHFIFDCPPGVPPPRH